MEHRQLGRTGVSVSKFCLGAMMFGAWGNPDHDDSTRIIHAALDAGINFIDTADVYGDGESEQIVGKALAGGKRDNVVLATKFYNPMGEDPNRRGASRRWIMQAVEDSLRRLGTDWIDLYQLHRFDTGTEIDETLGALTDLVHQGKIRYIGHSTLPASRIVEAQWVARDRHFERFVTEQPPYSILVRAIEADVLPTCRRYDIAVMSYSPLTGGWLSGRWRKEGGQQSSSRAGRLPERFDLSNPANQRKLDAVEQLAQLADEAGLTLIQLAIAWVLNHPAITCPLVGPRTMEQLETQLAAADVVLDEAVLHRIDEINPRATRSTPPTTPGPTRTWSRERDGGRQTVERGEEPPRKGPDATGAGRITATDGTRPSAPHGVHSEVGRRAIARRAVGRPGPRTVSGAMAMNPKADERDHQDRALAQLGRGAHRPPACGTSRTVFTRCSGFTSESTMLA